MQNAQKWKKRGLALLFAAAAFGAAALLAAYGRAGMQPAVLTPYLADARGWQIYSLENGRRVAREPAALQQQGGIFYLSRVLGAEYERAGYTQLELDGTRPSAVFLEGELLYTTCPGVKSIDGAPFPAGYAGLGGRGERVQVSLPAGYGQRELTLAVQGSGGKGTPMVALTSQAIFEGETAAAATRTAMPAAAFALAALLMLGLTLYQGAAGRWDLSPLLLAACALVQMLYYLQRYELFSAAPYLLNNRLAGFYRPLAAYLPMVFLLLHMRRQRRRCAAPLLVCIAAGLVPPCANLLGADLGGLYLPLELAVYPALGVLAVFSALEYREGNPVFRLAAPGMALAALAAAAAYPLSLAGSGEYAAYLRFLLSTPFYMQGWIGAALFTLCAGASALLAVRRTAAAQGEVQALQVKNGLAAENLRIVQQSSEALAAARHDMRHHLAAIAQLNQAGERQRLAAYVEQVAGKTEAAAPLRFTAHPTVNAILAATSAKAQAAGVELRLNVELPPTLPLPDTDLCSFLMNLLDNAVQGAAQAPAGGRWVEFTMHVRGRYLFIGAENAYEPGGVQFDPATGLPRSQRGEGHGYGVKILQSVARRYQSELQVEAGPERFLVRTALLLPQE